MSSLSAGSRRRIVLLVLCELVMLAVEARLPETSVGWRAVVFALMILSGMAAFFQSRDFEDESPKEFVNYLFGTSALAAGLALIAKGEYDLSQILNTLSYIVASWATLEILRVIERRPSYATLFILNATALIALLSNSLSFTPAALLMLACLMLLKRVWFLSYALLGAALGASIPGVAVAILFFKHQQNFVKKEGRWPTLVSSLAIYVLCAGAMWFLRPSPAMPADALGLALIASAVLLAGVFIVRAEVSGKDSLLYAIMVVLTLFVFAKFDLSAGAVLLLIPLGALFRSAPQLWLALIAGLLPFATAAHIPDWINIVMFAIFAILFLMQLRHAYLETGLFRTIELRE